MAPQQIHSAASPSPGNGDVEPGAVSHRYDDGRFLQVTLRGRPVDKSKTGGPKATKFIYMLAMADYTSTVTVTINLVPYLYTYLHQQISTAATINNNYTGTFFLLSVFGGFIADSYLGHYYTIISGAVIQLLGVALLVFTAVYSGLQPPACTPTLTAACPPAGAKYMAPIYVALYIIALGSGLIKSNNSAFGAEQFDDSDPVEKKQSTSFFVWYYFCQNVGLLLCFTLSVYLLDYVNKGWGFGWVLIFGSVGIAIFLAGTPKYRHKVVGGSFLTRVVKVFIAAIRKIKFTLPADDDQLYDAPIAGGWISRTDKLNFLDKAAIVEKDGKVSESGWRLAGVTQVEETKRILLLLPVWLSTAFISLIFSQVVTFTVTQGSTLDRSIGKHFVLPPASLGCALILMSLVLVPIYDQIFVPIMRRITKSPYGLSPLKRMGIASVTACLAMIVAALVEKKRLHYIRNLGLTQAPFFLLPMRMYWLLPQYFFSSLTEMFLFIAQYEFFYHEVSDATRSIGSSFMLSAISLGYYLSSVLVNVTNHVTKHHTGGSWLIERLNNGGLENYYWLLAAILAVNFFFFVAASHFYQYNYKSFLATKDQSAEDKELETRD